MTDEIPGTAWVRYLLVGEVAPGVEEDLGSAFSLVQGASTLSLPDPYLPLVIGLGAGLPSPELAELGGTSEVLQSLVEGGVCLDLGEPGSLIPTSKAWVSMTGGFFACEDPSLGAVLVDGETLVLPLPVLAALSSTSPEISLDDVMGVAAKAYQLPLGAIHQMVRLTLPVLVSVGAAVVVKGGPQ